MSATLYADSTRFADLMSSTYPTLQWEQLTVVTADRYELSLFHVWNEAQRDALGAQGPILFQHGGGQDAVGYL